MAAPDEHRFERLEERVDRIETSIAADIRRIFERLELLAVDSAKQACPSPGACIGLGDKLQHTMEMLTAQTMRVERLELKILEQEKLTLSEFRKVEQEFHKIDRQKAWLLGAWSVVAFISAIVGAGAAIAVKLLIK